MKKPISVLFASVILLTGCGNNSGSGSVSENAAVPENRTETAPDAAKDDIVLTMACVYEVWEPVREQIDKFNAEDNGIIIEIKNYTEDLEGLGCDEEGVFIGYNNDELKMLDLQVMQDLINKDDIDIIGPFSFGNGAKYEFFKQNGGCADLYGFMENDAEVNSGTLNEHILSLNECDGSLYSLPTHYAAWTMAGKTEYVGTERNWTIDEFIDCWNAMPEGASVNGSNIAEDIYYDVLRHNNASFVDYDDYEVDFDSEDFRRMLEFCGTFPSNMGDKYESDGINERLVQVIPITNYKSAAVSEMNYVSHRTEKYRLRDGSHTLVGFPTSDRRGAYLFSPYYELSICANISDERQQAAWQFIRELYTEEFQTETFATRRESYNPQTGDTYVDYLLLEGFPINNAARKNIAAAFVNGEYESSSTAAVPEDAPMQPEEIKPEQADISYIDDYIASIDRWESPNLDRELFSMVEEEVLAYLHGEHDIDTTIDLIQDRASIWISELE